MANGRVHPTNHSLIIVPRVLVGRDQLVIFINWSEW